MRLALALAARARQAGRVLVPFTLRLTAPVRLLLLTLADDPVYRDLEIQWVDSPDVGGAGIVVLAIRRDGTAEVYSEDRLSVPRADYEVASGLRELRAVPVAPARFAVTRRGVQLEVGLPLVDGRTLQVRVHEARVEPRPLVRMLAPAGHSMTDPTFFPFFWMEDIWFLRWRGAVVDVRVGGRRRRVVRAGAPWRLVRYATAPMTALWCEARDGEVPAVPDEPGEHPLGAAVARVTSLPDGPALAAVEVRRDGRALTTTFDPPFPSITGLPDGSREGRVSAWAAGRAQLGGAWSATRRGDHVSVTLDIDQPWVPGPQPAGARAVFELIPVFRRWPTTYRWDATINLSPRPVTMRSRWRRR